MSSADDAGDDPVTLDCRGMRCPLPVVELARTAARLGTGEVLLLADDPASEADVPAWCRLRGATLMASGRDGTKRWFRVAVG